MRKIVQPNSVGIKDENGIYMPVPKIKAHEEPLVEMNTPMEDISLDKLLNNCLVLLDREIKELRKESVLGKLSKDSAHSLRENAKLILDLKKKEKELLDGMSEEELREFIEKN